MSQPYHRVAADLTAEFRNVRPVDVPSQPAKNAQSALVRAMGQHDFVAFAECRTSRSGAHHVRVPPSFGISFAAPGLQSKLRPVHKPRFFQPDFRCFLFTRYAGGIPLRRFLIIKPLRFQSGGLGRRLQGA
jgi:hypothetical protein